MVGLGGCGVASFRVCEENGAKAERVKYSSHADCPAEIIIWSNCFSAIKAVGQFGQVVPLNRNRNLIRE